MGTVSPEVEAEVSALLRRLAEWASQRPDISAVALVGSWAGNEPRPDSDVDVIVLADHPERYLTDDGWTAELGLGRIIQTRQWGAITERRVRMGPIEVEFGIGTIQWASTSPVDPGTRRVVGGGLVSVYDPSGLLRALVDASRTP